MSNSSVRLDRLPHRFSAVLRDVLPYAAQADLARIAQVNKCMQICNLVNISNNSDFHNLAIPLLYSFPDLSSCTAQQLRSFVALLQSRRMKDRRSLVRSLDLTCREATQTPDIFHVPSFCGSIPVEQSIRHEKEFFEQAFRLFRNLHSIRIYGHSMTNGIKAHWKSLSSCLVELRIYNLGNLTDSGLIEIADKLSNTLQVLHLEHPMYCPESNNLSLSRGIRVGTVRTLLLSLTKLKSLGIGVPVQRVENDPMFIEDLFGLESLTLVRIPAIDFTTLHLGSSDAKWTSLVVQDCPGMRPEDLDAVLRRLPNLLSLEWRFPEHTYYNSACHELRFTVCRKLKRLILQNACLSDQCLMRILRVMSSLELLALAGCSEVNRVRSTCATHYVIKDMCSILPNIHDAFEECLFDMQSLVVLGQSFSDTKQFANNISWMFKMAKHLERVVLIECELGSDDSDLTTFVRTISKHVKVDVSGRTVRLDRIPRFVEKNCRVLNNGTVPTTRYVRPSPSARNQPSVSTMSKDGTPFDRTSVSSTKLSTPVDSGCSDSIGPTTCEHDTLEYPESQVAAQAGWGVPSKWLSWGEAQFDLIEQQKKTKFWSEHEVHQVRKHAELKPHRDHQQESSDVSAKQTRRSGKHTYRKRSPAGRSSVFNIARSVNDRHKSLVSASDRVKAWHSMVIHNATNTDILRNDQDLLGDTQESFNILPLTPHVVQTTVPSKFTESDESSQSTETGSDMTEGVPTVSTPDAQNSLPYSDYLGDIPAVVNFRVLEPVKGCDRPAVVARVLI